MRRATPSTTRTSCTPPASGTSCSAPSTAPTPTTTSRSPSHAGSCATSPAGTRRSTPTRTSPRRSRSGSRRGSTGAAAIRGGRRWPSWSTSTGRPRRSGKRIRGARWARRSCPSTRCRRPSRTSTASAHRTRRRRWPTCRSMWTDAVTRGRRITPAAEWFIDNYYVIEELAGDELLPAVDVVGRTRQGRVGHDVYGERGDVGRSDDAPDGERGAKLIAAIFEFIAEERCRQRCIDEACGDEVDSDGREFERQVGCEGGKCGGDCRRDPDTDAWAAAAGAAHEQQRASRSHLVGGVAGDLEYQQEMLVEGAARLRGVPVDEAPVVRPASCNLPRVTEPWRRSVTRQAGSCGVPVDFDDSFGKGIRSFLRHIVADAVEDSVRILA